MVAFLPVLGKLLTDTHENIFSQLGVLGIK